MIWSESGEMEKRLQMKLPKMNETKFSILKKSRELFLNDTLTFFYM